MSARARADLKTLYPARIDLAPFVVTGSPPLYIWLTRLLGGQGGQTFVAGRTVSMLSMLAAMVLIGLLCYSICRDIVSSVLAGLFLAMYPAVTHWGILNSPEMLGFAMSLAGMFAIRCLKGWLGVAVGLILFVAAAATSTSLLVAPVATCLIWLVLQKRRAHAIGLGAALAAIIVLGVLGLNAATNGGFSWHTIVAANRGFSPPQMFTYMLNVTLRSTIVLVLCVVYLAVERLHIPSENYDSSFPLSFLLTALAWGIMSGQIGANMSVTLMPAAAICLMMGVSFCWLGRTPLVRVLLLVVLFVQLTPLDNWRANEFTPDIQRKLNSAREMGVLAERFRAVEGDVLTDEYIGLLAANGKRVFLYPQEYMQLVNAGAWPEQDLVGAIERKQFGLIALYEPPITDGVALLPTRWTDASLVAMSRSYRRVDSLADAQILMP